MFNPNMSDMFTHELMPTKHYYMTEAVKEEEEIDYNKLDERQKFILFKNELK